MKKLLKPKDIADIFGVSVKTVQRWDVDGKLVAKRNPKGRRYYTPDQIDSFLNIQSPNGRKNVIYARVSSKSQSPDLKNQTDFLRQFANAKGCIVADVIEDIGSGLNYKRPKWNDLLDQVMDGKIGQIYVTEKDRFIRFGFDWFASFVKKYGAEIIVVNNETLSPQKEMVQDLISIIHVFSCKVYGLRKYKNKLKGDDEL